MLGPAESADWSGRDALKLPLPRGRWGPMTKRIELSQQTYKNLVSCTQRILRRLLVTECYDSVNNFLAFYKTYKGSDEPFFKIFKNYTAVIQPHSYNCVGLALELVRRWCCLEGIFEGLADATALMSCEETADNLFSDAEFTTGPYELPAPDKEHLLVGIHIILDGRIGILIADPGYHVARIVTVMLDELSPHTGRFNLVNEPQLKRYYSYSYSKKNCSYVEWTEDEIRRGASDKTESLIYAARSFCDGINITEKRNLVYHLRTLVSRSHTGQVTSGLFFFLSSSFDAAQFQILFQQNSKRVKKKFQFKDFRNISMVDTETLEEIAICNSQMKLPEGELLSIIELLVEITADETFINHCLDLSTYICEMSI